MLLLPVVGPVPQEARATGPVQVRPLALVPLLASERERALVQQAEPAPVCSGAGRAAPQEYEAFREQVPEPVLPLVASAEPQPGLVRAPGLPSGPRQA